MAVSLFCFSSSSTRCFLVFALFSYFLAFASSSESTSFCRHESELFLHGLRSQCPLEISPSPPLQVNGEFLDRLTAKQNIAYTSVLFYSSQCQFSRSMLSRFEKLSFMFPQIEHLKIEKSSAMPSVFSRYGIHSFPSVLLLNQTSMVRYRGSKTLFSLVQFYEKTTDLRPVQYYDDEEPVGWEKSDKSFIESLKRSLSKEMLTTDPYLVFAVLFLCLRVLAFIFPVVLSQFRAVCVSCFSHLNSEIFGETNQIMGRILHLVDVRTVWARVRLCKVRNFHERARNARVWASSLATVSG